MTDPIHASCVAVAGRGVLLTGPSGSGKSDLALRLIDRGAMLVADDCTGIERRGDALIARAPDTIGGRIEVRGLGIVALPALDETPVSLVVQLGRADERLPQPRTRVILGIALPEILLDAHTPSAAIQVELALKGRIQPT